MKASKPCDMCKGRFKQACIICGWAKKPKAKSLINAERIDRDGRREYIMMIDHYSRACAIHGNYTTQLAACDKQILEHREFADRIWAEVEDEELSLTTVAKKHDLTVNQVKRILATTLMIRNMGAANPLKPEPVRIKRSQAEVDAEIAEIRRKRDMPKPPKPATFAKCEDCWE